MKKSLLFVAFLFPFIFFGKALAVLDLELTQGVDTAIPIAIVPFADKNSDESNTLSTVLISDLKNSGQFKVLPQNQINAFPSQPNDIQLTDWENNFLNDIVVGSIKSLDNNRYQINFSLVDLFKKTNPDTTNNSVLMTKSLIVNKNSLRRVAHQIADQIFEQLTGINGCFDTKIAYILVKRQSDKPSQYDMMIADADGYQPQTLISSNDPMMSPAWSPDGKQIAYVSFENHHSSIYIIDISTGNRHLVSEQDGINGAPDWTRDGKQLAFVLSNGNNTKLVLFDLFSRQQTALTDGNSIDTEPSFSPDGKTMIFTSDRGYGSPEIYAYNLTTRTIQQISTATDYNARGEMTADMNHIVMLTRSDGRFNIVVQNLQNNDRITLTDDSNASSPSVSPNGMMVIYATRQNKQGLLGLVSVDGRAKLMLPDNEGSVQDPAWGPVRS